MSDQDDWTQLFRIACAMIRQVNAEQEIIAHWTFGGGTAMMLQIGHRKSHDVDIFLPDPQWLPLLDPEKRDFDFTTAPAGYSGDGTKFLKLNFEFGEIDFIIAQTLTSSPTTKTIVEGELVVLDTVPEVIAKKIYHRGSGIMPRDIFDIAAGSETHAQAIVKELASYPDKVANALAAIDRLNPDFVNASIEQLLIADPYKAVAKTALGKATELLKAV